MMPTQHVPVLATEVIDLLQPQPGAIFIDGTLGGGGHAALLLDGVQPKGALYGFDQDPEAIALVTERLGNQYGPQQFIPIVANAATIKAACDTWNISGRVQGILFDLGYSSDQLARGRGFSFRALSDPLDLRMDPSLNDSAADLLNTGTVPMLVELFRNYGEVKHPQQLARTIAEWRLDRPIETVADLVACVQQAYHTQSSDVLAKVWQACRIAVNDELNTLQAMLVDSLSVLSPGGRMAVITFHSLEDRIVKQLFKQWSDTKCICPPEVPICVCQREPLTRLLTKHAVGPSAAEIKLNPRSRSAKVRAIEKL